MVARAVQTPGQRRLHTTAYPGSPARRGVGKTTLARTWPVPQLHGVGKDGGVTPETLAMPA